jgi:hypothetical protein
VWVEKCFGTTCREGSLTIVEKLKCCSDVSVWCSSVLFCPGSPFPRLLLLVRTCAPPPPHPFSEEKLVLKGLKPRPVVHQGAAFCLLDDDDDGDSASEPKWFSDKALVNVAAEAAVAKKKAAAAADKRAGDSGKGREKRIKQEPDAAGPAEEPETIVLD